MLTEERTGLRSTLRARLRRTERAQRREVRRLERVQQDALGVASVDAPQVDIPPNDPVLAYFQTAPGPVDVERLELESPGVESLRRAGVKLVVPMVAQGELIGLLNLGDRLSEQEYSTDDRRLLASLASQTAPALRVAQLVREQEHEVRTRERYQQELRVATLIQQNFLPKEAPRLDGWEFSAFYRPAREVGGDFYDFIDLPDGRLGLVCADVTDKGVPAALVMASTRSVLRGAGRRGLEPGAVLERVNELVCPEIPPKMFVTCLYGVLDPADGRFHFANAGHNPPVVRGPGGDVFECRATGMPLGLLPGMSYEEKEVFLEPGSTFLLYSDGLDEAHAPDGDMFGFPRVFDCVGRHGPGELVDGILEDLDAFTGAGWEQEDDITLVAVRRAAGTGGRTADAKGEPVTTSTEVIAAFELPSEIGNERLVMERVSEAVTTAGIDPARLARLETAVSEAAMNAIEHGNGGRPELPVRVEVVRDDGELVVRITDRGSHAEIPEDVETPDLQAKLDGLQSPRGWGLFLIKEMVDDMRVSGDDDHHVVELVVRLEGASDA